MHSKLDHRRVRITVPQKYVPQNSRIESPSQSLVRISLQAPQSSKGTALSRSSQSELSRVSRLPARTKSISPEPTFTAS